MRKRCMMFIRMLQSERGGGRGQARSLIQKCSVIKYNETKRTVVRTWISSVLVTTTAPVALAILFWSVLRNLRKMGMRQRDGKREKGGTV